jgi:Tol biopolymer transport system component
MRVPIIGLGQGHFAVAPDGREIAVVAQPDGHDTTAIFVRRVDAPVFRRLPGTEEAVQPFWSPDSRSIAFVVGGRLKRVDASGGAPKDIAPVSSFAGGAWNRANTIVFGSDKGLFQVSAEGGTPEPVTGIEAPDTGHIWPSFLPDGRHYLFSIWSGDPSRRAVYVGSLDAKERTRLMDGETNVVYAASAGMGRASGYLLFHREASLFAQPFDPESRTTSGSADQVTGGLAYDPLHGRGYFAASDSGVLVFDQSTSVASGRGRTTNQQFAWVNRKGGRLDAAVPSGPHGDIALSADRRFVAITRHEAGAPGADIWIRDWKAGNEYRLTMDPSDDINPVWSPTGDQVAFTTWRAGNADIFVKNANGLGAELPLVQTPADEFVEDWSHDGRYLACLVGRDGGYQDIYVIPLAGDRKPIPVVLGPFRKDEFSHYRATFASTRRPCGALGRR